VRNGYSGSEGVATFVHEGRGGWDGEFDIEPIGGDRRFGVDRRPLNPALRGIGAKAILIGTSESSTSFPFDVVKSKLQPPPGPPRSVPRTALVNRLRAAGAFPLVLVTAPAGYGKTTLLSQWAARDARPFAWVSVDERDDDPFVLLKHVAAAIDRIEPLGAHVTEAFNRPDQPVWDAIVPRLTAELSSRTAPFVIVLDGADAVKSTDSTEAIGILIENIPPGSMIALAGRSLPRMPIAALRVAGPLLEIGPYELALSRREAELLIRGSGVELDENEISGLLLRTEGWAAGLRLAALASLEDADHLSRLAGDDRYIADYLRSEYLTRVEPRVLRFLRRTSVLERMCAPLCNAVLGGKGSAGDLEEIERANLFLVQLDHHRGWYRYHHLFRDLLQRELAEQEPDLVSTLHRRAAAWYETHLDPESALFHAHAAGDIDDAARILSSIAQQVNDSGRAAVVEGWLDLFDVDERLDRHPAVAVQGSSILAARGRADEADRWLHAAERGVASRRRGVAAVRPRIAVMRAALCTDGPAQMQTDARAAVSKLAADDPWRPAALLVRGAADMLLGDTENADAALVEAVERAATTGSTETRAIALGERSMLAAAREDVRTADALAEEARRVVEEGDLAGYPTSALALAASARSRLRHGQWDHARRLLTAATRLTPHLTYALPWLAVQARIELTDAYVTLRDREAAQHMLEEARGILALRPGLGVLGDGVERLGAEIAGMPEPRSGANSGLTRAELRLLPLLSTHLSFREIGERLHVSRNTVKTQAISVYRKLGVSSRSDAVAVAEDIGLVEAVEPRESQLKLGEAVEPLVF
jgi:LuxR family transcriptional regulator, maltose regulon positive regulatory protein